MGYDGDRGERDNNDERSCHDDHRCPADTELCTLDSGDLTPLLRAEFPALRLVAPEAARRCGQEDSLPPVRREVRERVLDDAVPGRPSYDAPPLGRTVSALVWLMSGGMSRPDREEHSLRAAGSHACGRPFARHGGQKEESS